MSIEHLPPELLAIVLSNEKISLRQRIALRAVSSHWLATLEENVLKLTTKLELNTDDYNHHVSENHLPFTAKCIPLLTRLFPIVADLSVTMKYGSPSQELPQFLKQFSTTLKTLQLWNIDNSKINKNKIWAQDFISAINSLTGLTSLGLNLDYKGNTSTILPQLLPTLTRLQQFNYTTKGCFKRPHPIWQSFINNPLTRMTHLKIGPLITSDYVATLADIVATFPSLQSLSLSADSSTLFQYQTIRLTDMLRHLSSLEHLSELCLSAPYQIGTQMSLPLYTDRRLLNVKKLNWSIQFEPIKSPESNHPCAALAAWFPRLEQLTIDSEEDEDSEIQITSTMLNGLLSLEYLTELSLFQVDYASRLTNPKPTDRLFTGVKKLNVMSVCYYCPEGGLTDLRKSHIISLLAWFPNLASLTVGFFDDVSYPLFQLTSPFLRDLARLECLTSLKLPKMLCAPYLEAPLPTDRPLTSLKSLNLIISENSSSDENEEAPREHCCSAVAAWCPRLEELTVNFPKDDNLCFGGIQLTSSRLRDLANLEYLRKLYLPKMRYSKMHMDVPSPTDRPLTCLKMLSLEVDDSPAEFDGEHCCSAVAAWFPNLEWLTIEYYGDGEDYYKFPLTSNMLRDLGRLEHLSDLHLPPLFYEKKRLEMPLPTDRPLTCLKYLPHLFIIDSPAEFDGEHFCSTVAAWFPHLESLFISINDKYQYNASEPCYRRSIKANRHHFGSSNLYLYFSYWYDWSAGPGVF